MATPSTNIRNKVATILNTMNAEEREELLNQLWLPLVIQDVQSHLKDRIDNTDPNDKYRAVTNDEIEHIAHRFVYERDYDCNQDYWSNLDALIDNVIS